MIGQSFGMLLVEGALTAEKGRGRVAVRCACGNKKTVLVQSLKSGATKSCGCMSLTPEGRERRRQARVEHGYFGTPTYRSWAHMKERCLNPSCRQFKWYGALGVTVCDEWMEFEAFLRDMDERPAGTTLDRCDPSGNYEPGNCRWADSKTQRINRREVKA